MYACLEHLITISNDPKIIMVSVQGILSQYGLQFCETLIIAQIEYNSHYKYIENNFYVGTILYKKLMENIGESPNKIGL